MEVTFASDALMRWTDISVILPFETAGRTDRVIPEKFPTLYLLHGYSGNHKDWPTFSNIRRYAEDYNMAVVMMNGENSFYVDNPDLGLTYGSFIRELVDVTRKMFPLSDRREDTYIGGFSMGGFGAARNGYFYSDIFSKIISLSGAFIVDDVAAKPMGPSAGIAGPEYYKRVFGDFDQLLESDKNPIYCAKQAKERGNLPEIFQACGTEDFVLENNRRFKNDLEQLGITVEYHEAEGNHDWKFWDHWIVNALEWLTKKED